MVLGKKTIHGISYNPFNHEIFELRNYESRLIIQMREEQ